MSPDLQNILVWVILGFAITYLILRARKKKGCGSKDSCCGTGENKIAPKSDGE